MLETIQGEVRSEPLNNNFSLLYDGLKNSKASVPDFESLPTTNNEEGDYRIVTGGEHEGQLYWWNGTEWQSLKQDASNITAEEMPLLSFLEMLQGEFDTNDDGTYLRLPNGLQVCWHIIEIDKSEVEFQSSGSIYRTNSSLTWSFPKPFINDAAVFPDVNKTTTWATRTSTGSTSSINYRLFQVTDAPQTFIVHLFAIGRWK